MNKEISIFDIELIVLERDCLVFGIHVVVIYTYTIGYIINELAFGADRSGFSRKQGIHSI